MEFDDDDTMIRCNLTSDVNIKFKKFKFKIEMRNSYGNYSQSSEIMEPKNIGTKKTKR